MVANHEPVVPGSPRVGTMEDRVSQWSVRAQCSRIRGGDAKWMAEDLPLLVLRIGENDDHQTIELVNAGKEQVVHSLERSHATVACDRRDVAAAVLRPNIVVQEDDTTPRVA